MEAIKAAVIEKEKGKFHLKSLHLQDLMPHEVLVKIKGAGICHTDLTARDQSYDVPLPMVLGHEGSGVVHKVGKEVRKVKEGDHVVLTYGSCGICRTCLEGTPQYCEKFFGLNFGGERMETDQEAIDQKEGQVHSRFFQQSSFATYSIATERNVVKVDKEAPLELLGPLGCGIQTGAGAVINSLRPVAGSTIAIFGAGSVGLSAVMAAKICGCLTIIAVDINEERLKLAMELGATHTVNSKEVDDVVVKIKELTDQGPDYAVESSGIPKVLAQAVAAVRWKGKVAVVGAPPMGETAPIDVNQILVWGKQIIGVVEGDSIPDIFIPRLIEYHKNGQFPFDKLVTNYPFEKINEAIADMEAGKAIKPILTF
jgi:aryl-alcohol dehydrogenase